MTMEEHKNITDYARGEAGVELFIENVISAGLNGKKGYFCIGCGNEMVAVKNQGDYRNYFRHYGKNGTANKCTWSSETYRHSIAKKELASYKKVKLPTMWKFSPDLSEKIAIRKFKKTEDSVFNGLNIIRGFAHAYRAENELYFYMIGGVIHYSEPTNRPSRFDEGTLMQPDVTFFNSRNEPALFIEIVATHKPDTEKIAKLVNIGIDTIEILVPKDSRENIIKSIRHESKRTKWTFASEVHRIKWHDCRPKYGKAIQGSSDEDRGIGGESCCIAEINSAERIFYSFMASDEFDSAKDRIEQNIRTNKIVIEARKDAERKAIIRDSVEARKDRESVQRRYRDMEIRYHTKKKELDDGIRERESRMSEKDAGARGVIEFRIQNEFDEIRRGIERDYSKEENSIREEEDRISEEFRGGIQGLRDKVRGLNDRIKQYGEALETVRNGGNIQIDILNDLIGR